MTAGGNIERALPRILEELGRGPAPDYEDALLRRTAAARQRPGWAVPAWWLQQGGPAGALTRGYLPARQLAFLLLLLAALAASLVVYAGSRTKRPPPFGPAANGLVVIGVAGDIVVGDPVAGQLAPIAGGSEYDFMPFYSRDGSQVAFLRRAVSEIETAVHLLVVNADGSDLRFLGESPLLEIPWQAEWSPDGREIAVVTSPRADAQLLFFEATGTRAPRAVDPGMRVSGIAYQPPDGRRIVFRGERDYKIGLYTMNVDGTDVRTLVEPYLTDWRQDHDIHGQSLERADLRGSAWSPDGTLIVFRRHEYLDGAERMVLYLMDADGAGVRRVGYTPGDLADTDPAWSPDGSQIAFLRYRDDVFRFVVVNLADGALVETGPLISDGLASLEWAPDGTRLLAIEHSDTQRALILDPSGGPWQAMPSAVEVPGWWTDNVIANEADVGAWQRLASP